ncbi:hypothetical protein LOD99_16188 [Oopsacas minuta]|uniref:Histone-lysine N-methyltransferase, H3 lysine-79 specific n=1 Tax=Oopsacas minuta TaxID=111878 RepID=A0AAV7K6J6_9METZ|nr:hypothetical protein LOD99_16188 [Oopsacas minuta]
MPETKKKDKSLKLNSPVGLTPVIYRWPLQSQEGYDEAHELIESMRWVCHDFPDLRVAVENYILDRIDLSDYDRMSLMCDRFNRAADNIRRLGSGIEPPKCIGAPPSRDLLKHIMVQVYNRSIPDPDKLNSYQPFSPQVYGESSYDLVADVISELKITEDDIFLDLGSGVGNVVLQVAAAANCTCYGIEKNEIPADYAKEMEEEFLQWMDWYGKSFGDFELLHGDFLDADNYSYIKKSTIIFVNNFAFGPRLNHKLKEIFSGLSDGTRIVTSLELAPLNFHITPRTLSDLGSILRVSKLSATEGNVSWTDKPVSYYLHVIDRTKLEKYFQQQKRKEERESSMVPEGRAKRKRRKQSKKSGRKRRVTTSSEDSISLTPTDPSDFYMSSEDNEEGQMEMRASLDILVERYRQQVTEFLDKMQTQEFKDQIIEQIQFERDRKLFYTEKIAELEQKIREILNDGANSIRKVMTEFGIDNQTPTGLTNGARAMLVQNRQLKEETRVLEERVTKLEEEHKELLRDCKESMGEEVFEPVANRLDLYLQCHDPKLIDWSSPLTHIPPPLSSPCIKPPSHPLTPPRRRMRDPKKRTCLIKQKDKLELSSPSSTIPANSPPSVTPLESAVEAMDTTATPQTTTSIAILSKQTQEEIEIQSKPLIQLKPQRELSAITISSSPSPPHEPSFSIKSITRPSRDKPENTTLIPSPSSSLVPPVSKELPAPPEIAPPTRQQPLLAPRTPAYLPFFPYLQNNPLYSQFLDKQAGLPYPFYPIALSQQQIMNMYYSSQLSPDKIAPPVPGGTAPEPLPHMPITNFPLPALSPELLNARGSSRSKQKRTDKSKRKHPRAPVHVRTGDIANSTSLDNISITETVSTSKYKPENQTEKGNDTPIYTPASFNS